MKKIILAIIAVATLSITACKKEEVATPSVKSKIVADQKDNGNWDVVADQTISDTLNLVGDQKDNGNWDIH
ncbi:MAG: hypothetical protein K0S09_250 [Sphingobacteriaceae bacterium]|jgi:hypothetical protein|nr:hypothetical protein [Sphingobacteriaceae bacterium]